MGATDLLEHLEGIGLSLTAAGGNIEVQPRSALTGEALDLIREHKQELLAVLSARRPNGSCAGYKDSSIYGNCAEPAAAGLADGFSLIEPPASYATKGSTFTHKANGDPVLEELAYLVRRVAAFHSFSREEWDEAMEIALADPPGALRCFRRLAEEIDQLITIGVAQRGLELNMEAI